MKTACSPCHMFSACLFLATTMFGLASDRATIPLESFPGFNNQGDTAEILALTKEFHNLEPFNVTATNFTTMKLSCGTLIAGYRDVGLRIERFLCAEQETELGWVRHSFETNGITRFKVRLERVRDEAMVEKGRERNRDARRVFAEFLSNPHPEASAAVQEFWFAAALSVWIDGVNGHFRESESTARRREEDGIPSAEALLEWFAKNENFSENVRTEAKSRLDRLASERQKATVSSTDAEATGKERTP